MSAALVIVRLFLDLDDGSKVIVAWNQLLGRWLNDKGEMTDAINWDDYEGPSGDAYVLVNGDRIIGRFGTRIAEMEDLQPWTGGPSTIYRCGSTPNGKKLLMF